MSDLDSIKTNTTKRYLKGIHFDFEGAHLALTEKSQGGACSLLNDPLLLKSLKDKTLSAEQETLLEKLGKDLSEVAKSAMEEETNSSSSVTEGIVEEDNKTINKENQTIMSDDNKEILKRLEIAEAALAVATVEKALQPYALDNQEDLAKAISTLSTEQVGVVVKSLGLLVDRTDAAVTKALEENKAEDNELAKTLEKEVGHEEDQEINSEELTLVEKMKLEKQKEAK